MDLPDHPAATVPYVHRRTVHWGDRDLVGIIYTPRFLGFVLDAMARVARYRPRLGPGRVSC